MHVNSQPAANEHLIYFESKIDTNLLEQFRLTKRRGHDWEGAEIACELYKVWLSITNDIPQPQNPSNEDDDVLMQDESEAV